MLNLAHEGTVMRGGREHIMLYCIYMSVKASIQQVLDLVYFLSECASQVEKKKKM